MARPSPGFSLRRAEAPLFHLDPRAQPSWLGLPRVSVKLKKILSILSNHVGLACSLQLTAGKHMPGAPSDAHQSLPAAFSAFTQPRPSSLVRDGNAESLPEAGGWEGFSFRGGAGGSGAGIRCCQLDRQLPPIIWPHLPTSLLEIAPATGTYLGLRSPLSHHCEAFPILWISDPIFFNTP